MTITRIIILLAWCCLYPMSVWGAPVLPGGAGLEQKLSPRKDKLPETDFEKLKAVPKLLLPPVEPQQRSDSLSTQLRVFVRQFKFVGNHVFSDSELAKITASYEDRVVTSAELQEIRNKISLYYLESGYINSGASIPDQQVKDSVITLKIIEGELTRIVIAGNKQMNSQYLQDRLMHGAGEPLNIKTLEQELKILQQNPAIKRLNAELRPGDRLGESVLYVQIEENRRGRANISFNNHRPPSIGAEQVELEATLFSLTGLGDPLIVSLDHSKGFDDLFMLYQLPVNKADTRMGFYFEYTDSNVIEAPFSELNIKTNATTRGISVSHPLQRTAGAHLTVGMALEQRNSNSSMLGIPFSFSEGVNNGRADVTPLRLSIDWLKRDFNSVLAARSIVSVGLDALGASINSSAPDGRFVTWLGQLQWVQRFGERGYQAIFKASAQLADRPLLPLEKFAVGGYDTVRGYRQNQLVRDNGFIASAELRIPFARQDNAEARWQVAPFIDYGNAWNKDRATPAPRDIASAGLVLYWQPTTRLQASISTAYAFKKINLVNQKRDLQDKGIYFSLNYQLY